MVPEPDIVGVEELAGRPSVQAHLEIRSLGLCLVRAPHDLVVDDHDGACLFDHEVHGTDELLLVAQHLTGDGVNKRQAERQLDAHDSVRPVSLLEEDAEHPTGLGYQRCGVFTVAE